MHMHTYTLAERSVIIPQGVYSADTTEWDILESLKYLIFC